MSLTPSQSVLHAGIASQTLPPPHPTPPHPPTHHYLHLAACSYLNQGKLDPNGVELADVQNLMGELRRSNQI